METYANILLIAIPIFIVLVIGEKLYGFIKLRQKIDYSDVISSLSSGLTNSIKDVLGVGISIISYNWLFERLAFVSLESSFLLYIIAFISLDFAGYWGHRIDHFVSFFWNGHLIHHSSQNFDLACALRQPISVWVNIFTIFLLPAALLGVPPKVIATIAPIHFFAQFWYHTKYIDKIGFLEKILVSPSHHRVHHAINEEYLDKNLGQIFIFWDYLFGTFQKELKEVPPVYGITSPVNTWNPIKINFIHIAHIIKEAWKTKSFGDKLRLFYMPPGWLPQDLIGESKKETNVYKIPIYTTNLNTFSKLFSGIQLIFSLFLTVLLYSNIANLSSEGMLSLGAFIFLSVFSFTEFMDKNKNAGIIELIKSLIGIIVIYNTELWEPIFINNPILKIIITVYLVFSVIITFTQNQASSYDSR